MLLHTSTDSCLTPLRRAPSPSLLGPAFPRPAATVDSSALRKTLRIRCTGDGLPPLWPAFSAFPHLSDGNRSSALANLAAMQVAAPTPIQMQAASIIYAQRDLLACAPTGSGKTLAFLLPALLGHLRAKAAAVPTQGRAGPRIVVLEPTRELARQVYTEAGKLRAGTDWKVALLGEEEGDRVEEPSQATESNEHAAIAPSEGADLLITTPLKLVYAVKQKQIDLSG